MWMRWYTYNPLEGKQNDKNTEKTVLMKCEVCGYKEAISLKSLETIRKLPPVSDILCPFCLNYMYEDKDNTSKQ